MSEDTFMHRLNSFMEMLTYLPGTQDMSELHEYARIVELSLRANAKQNMHKMAIKNFIQENKDTLLKLSKDMKLVGRIQPKTGKGYVDIAAIWTIIENMGDNEEATTSEDNDIVNVVKSDFLQWLFGVIEKSGLFPIDYDAKKEEIVSLFGEGTKIEPETEPKNQADSADINQLFEGDDKESKFIRGLLGNIQKQTRNKNPMSAMSSMMNPQNLGKLMGLVGGKKQGINLRKLINKLSQMVPEDTEI